MQKKKDINVNQRTLFDIDFNKDNKVETKYEEDEFTKQAVKDELEKFEKNAIGFTWNQFSKVFKGELEHMIEDIFEKKLNESNKKKVGLGVSHSETIEIKTADLEKVKETFNRYNRIKIDYNFDDYILFSNIREILEKEGLKQSWLQEKTGIPVSTFRSIINNEKAVSLENAFKISTVMGIPIEKLFTFEKMNLEDIELKTDK